MTARRLSLLALAVLAVPALAEDPPQPGIVQDVQVEADWIILTLSRPVGYSTKMQADPPVLSVTLDNAVISEAAKNRTVSDGTVRGVNSERTLTNGVSHVRMDFQLDTARAFSPSWSDSELTIKLQEPVAKTAAPPAAAPPAAAAPAAAPAPPPPPAPAPATAKPAAAKPAASGPAAPKRAFHVQFGSFPKEESAQRLKKQLEPKLGALDVRQAEVAGKTVYRVTQGAFARRAAAKEAMDQAAAKGAAGIIVRD